MEERFYRESGTSLKSQQYPGRKSFHRKSDRAHGAEFPSHEVCKNYFWGGDNFLKLEYDNKEMLM